MSVNWGAAGRGAIGAGTTGAAIGTMFLPGVGTAIGGGIGALAGGLAGAFGSGDSEDEIYQRLMQEYLNSPDRAREQKALDDVKAQTVSGPTAQEKASLGLALRTTNDQFNSSYGSILSNLRARSSAGGGGAAEAALAASEGANRSNNMAQMAESAAGQEDARAQQARQAYAQMATQVQQIGDQYRRWASGKAHGDSMTNEAQMSGSLAQVGNAAAQGIAAYKQGQKDPSGAKIDAGHDSEHPYFGNAPGASDPLSGPGQTDEQLSAHRQRMDQGFRNFLDPQPSLPTGMVQQPQQQPNQMQNPADPWRERSY